jgi:hypothetical protein
VAFRCRENNDAVLQASLKARRQGLPPKKIDSAYDAIM